MTPKRQSKSFMYEKMSVPSCTYARNTRIKY